MEWLLLLINSLAAAPQFLENWYGRSSTARRSASRKSPSSDENNFFKQEQFWIKSLPILALQTKMTKMMKPIREMVQSVVQEMPIRINKLNITQYL